MNRNALYRRPEIMQINSFTQGITVLVSDYTH